MSELRSRVVSGLRWQVAAKFGSQIVSWAITIVVMRILAPADYGLMAMTMVLVGLTALVAEMGLGAALIRSPEVTLDEQRSVFGLALMVNTGLYAALLALAPLSVAVFDEPRLWSLTAVVGLQLPLAALNVVPESMARRELRFKALSLVELVAQVGAAITTLACAWAGLGAWALALGLVAATALKAAMLLLRFGTVRPRLRLRGQQALIRFGGSLTANRVVWFVYSQSDVFIAGKLLGPQLLGAYAAAINLANMPMQKLMAVSNQVAFSAFSRLQTDRAAMAAGVLHSLRLTNSIAIGLLWGLAGSAPLLIPLLLGPHWQATVVPLQIVSFVVPLRITSTTLSTAAIAAGQVGLDLRNNITALALLAPAFVVGAWLGGVDGLALAWLTAYPLVFALLVHRLAPRLGITLGGVLRQLARPAAAGAAMLAVLLVLPRLGLAVPPAALLAIMIVCGGAAFVAAIWLLDRDVVREAIGFVRGAPRALPSG